MVVHPPQQVLFAVELGVVGVFQFVDLGVVLPLQSTVQPGTNQQLLPPPGVGTGEVLAANVAGDRALVHEVVPAANGEAGDVHLVEVKTAVFLLPVVVEGGVFKPFGHEGVVVGGDPADLAHGLKALGAGDATDAIALVIEAEAGVDHVLGGEVRGAGDGEEVLGEPGLRAAEGAHLARGPGLRPQPFAGVVAIFAFAPAQGAVANPRPFGQASAAEVDPRHNVAPAGEAGEGLAGAGPLEVGVALLKEDGPGALAFGEVEVRREPDAVAHGNHHMLFANPGQLERGEPRGVELRGGRGGGLSDGAGSEKPGGQAGRDQQQSQPTRTAPERSAPERSAPARTNRTRPGSQGVVHGGARNSAG